MKYYNVYSNAGSGKKIVNPIEDRSLNHETQITKMGNSNNSRVGEPIN